MKDEIATYINKCSTCAKTKYKRRSIKTKFQIYHNLERPLEYLMIDTLHYERKCIITIMDTFSKRLNADIIRTNNATNIHQVLTKYLSLYPPPIQITMDQGREYENALIQNLIESLGITCHYTVAKSRYPYR